VQHIVRACLVEDACAGEVRRDALRARHQAIVRQQWEDRDLDGRNEWVEPQHRALLVVLAPGSAWHTKTSAERR
jgi:hypothetical protein